MKILRTLFINCRYYWTVKRLLPVFIFSFIYTFIFLSQLKETAKFYNEFIPWSVWSLLFTDEFYIGLTITSVLFLFSCLPFSDPMQIWLILKIGYRKWGIVQTLYIALSSLLFTVVHFLMAIVYLIPQGLPLNTWGRLIKNLSVGAYTPVTVHFYLNLNPIAINFYTPLRAILQVFIMLFLITFLVGMVIFVFNMLVPNLGLILSGGLIVLSFFFSFAGGLWIYYLSPLNWLDLYQIRHTPYSGLPTFSSVVSWAVAIILVIGFIGYLFLRKKEVYHNGNH